MLIPAIRERVLWRMDQLRIYLRYEIFPPEEAVFVPQEDYFIAPSLVPSTAPLQQVKIPTSTRVMPPSYTEPSDGNSTPSPTCTPTFEVAQLPSYVYLEGVRYEDQHGLWNYCAPANLSMALSFWGWEGDRTITGAYLKPEEDDKNVMPYEMVDFVQMQTDLNAVTRPGGTIALLKTFLASGFPVLIEKGVFTRETLSGRMTWMGHYALLIGYNDAKEQFISRDSYYSPPEYPLDFPIDYSDLPREWRGFNYTFIVIFSVDKTDQVLQILGQYADEEESNRIALDTAEKEITEMSGLDLFLATFNKGTSLTRLYDYNAAAAAFDEAFTLYANLDSSERPYRIMWYQTGPYFAYYYTNRYQDVIDLATTTITTADKPYLEESWYWRGLAKIALGDTESGIEDLRASLKYHPGFEPSVAKLQELGVSE